MFARSNTITGADPQRMDAGIAMVRDEVLPAVSRMEGSVGLSMLVDRATGRGIVTSAWESDQAMSATSGGVEPMRRRVMDVMGGQLEVQEWEIGIMHRAHHVPDGASCRVTWTRGDPAGADDMMAAFRSDIMPRLDDLPGFCSVSLMVDRQSGMCVLTSVYDDRDSMQRASGDVRAMREQFTGRLGLEVVDMAEFEVAIHSLRVPEMA